MTDDLQQRTKATLRDVLWERIAQKARTDAALQNLLDHIRSGMDREVALLLTVDLLADTVSRMTGEDIERRRREPNRHLTLDEFQQVTQAEWDYLMKRPPR